MEGKFQAIDNLENRQKVIEAIVAWFVSEYNYNESIVTELKKYLNTLNIDTLLLEQNFDVIEDFMMNVFYDFLNIFKDEAETLEDMYEKKDYFIEKFPAIKYIYGYFSIYENDEEYLNEFFNDMKKCAESVGEPTFFKIDTENEKDEDEDDFEETHIYGVKITLRNYPICKKDEALIRIKKRLNYKNDDTIHCHNVVGVTKADRGTEYVICVFTTMDEAEFTKWFKFRFGPTSGRPWVNCKVGKTYELTDRIKEVLGTEGIDNVLKKYEN
jgi:hypothetical protein